MLGHAGAGQHNSMPCATRRCCTTHHVRLRVLDGGHHVLLLGAAAPQHQGVALDGGCVRAPRADVQRRGGRCLDAQLPRLALGQVVRQHLQGGVGRGQVVSLSVVGWGAVSWGLNGSVGQLVASMGGGPEHVTCDRIWP
jgi:hypothetical protein